MSYKSRLKHLIFRPNIQDYRIEIPWAGRVGWRSSPKWLMGMCSRDSSPATFMDKFLIWNTFILMYVLMYVLYELSNDYPWQSLDYFIWLLETSLNTIFQPKIGADPCHFGSRPPIALSWDFKMSMILITSYGLVMVCYGFYTLKQH